MSKTALVTGASSGIGREIAIELDRRGFDLIITARREDRLNELKNQLSGNVTVITADLTDRRQCYELYEKVSDLNVSVVINNAGFGAIGNFAEMSLERDLEMLDINCAAVHILTKLFLVDFKKKNRGYILNVASSAGLMAGGPMMATYYATKSYVVDLTCAINQELKQQGSNVQVSALCPGPVDTEFNDVAGCTFGLGSISAEYCAKYAVKHLFERKMLIIPEMKLKALNVVAGIMPRRLTLYLTGTMQQKKIK